MGFNSFRCHQASLLDITGLAVFSKHACVWCSATQKILQHARTVNPARFPKVDKVLEAKVPAARQAAHEFAQFCFTPKAQVRVSHQGKRRTALQGNKRIIDASIACTSCQIVVVYVARAHLHTQLFLPLTLFCQGGIWTCGVPAQPQAVP